MGGGVERARPPRRVVRAPLWFPNQRRQGWAGGAGILCCQVTMLSVFLGSCPGEEGSWRRD